MPAPTLMDLGSGMDTKGTINKLMELEKIPIQRLEQQNKLSQIKISAWNEVRNRTQALQNKSNLLQSFSGSFAINEVLSSDPGAISGQAAPEVNPGKQQIEVIQLAKNHALHSSALNLEEALPAAKFKITVNKRTIDFDFSGGKPRALLNYLKSRGGAIFEAHGVQVDENNLMIALRSKTTGSIGKLEFEDSDQLLNKIGLTGSVETEEKVSESSKLEFEKNLLAEIPQNKADSNIYSLSSDKLALKMDKDGRVVWKHKLGQDASLEINYSLVQQEKPEVEKKTEADSKTQKSPDTKNKAEDLNKKDVKAESTTIGPKITVQVGDVSLEAYNIKRDPLSKVDPQTDNTTIGDKSGDDPRKSGDKQAPAQIKVGVQYLENGALKERFIVKKLSEDKNPQEGKLELKVSTLTDGKEATAIWFETIAGQSRFFEPVLNDLVVKKSQKPANETVPAQDAKLKINGIELTRNTNHALSDIIEGVSLDLNKVTNGPVTVSVETKSDEIVNEIKEWVATYNDLLGFCREVTKSEKNDISPQIDANGQPINKKQSGIFANDSTLRQLVTLVRTNTSSAFPVISNNGYRVLSDIGISTGDPGQNWEDIKAGKLNVDDQKLRQVLSQNPEGVRNLFASDTNEDNHKESGVAVSLVKILQPYNRRAGGLITARIDMINESIKMNKDEMYKKELALKNKEDSLRQKFGRMERHVNQSRSMGEYLKRQNQSNQ